MKHEKKTQHETNTEGAL